MANATVDIIAPKTLILPESRQQQRISGALFISGSKLILSLGTRLFDISGSYIT